MKTKTGGEGDQEYDCVPETKKRKKKGKKKHRQVFAGVDGSISEWGIQSNLLNSRESGGGKDRT